MFSEFFRDPERRRKFLQTHNDAKKFHRQLIHDANEIIRENITQQQQPSNSNSNNNMSDDNDNTTENKKSSSRQNNFNLSNINPSNYFLKHNNNGKLQHPPFAEQFRHLLKHIPHEEFS